MKLLINLPEFRFQQCKDNMLTTDLFYVLADAVKNSQIITDDCEILTKEAYADLCARASMPDQERWLKGL